MGRVLLYTLLTVIAVSILSCKRYVCPAYQSAFLMGEGHSDIYFYPFENDSIPKTTPLFIARKKHWNGLVKDDPWWKRLVDRNGPIAQLFTGKTGKYNKNEPDVILGYPTWPPLEDSLVSAELAEDSTIIEADGTLDVGIDFDTTSTEIAIEDTIPEVPKRFDQYWYEMQFGHLLESPEDSTADAADSVMTVQRKWWQFWKPKFYEVPILSEDDSIMLNTEKKWWQFWKPKYVERVDADTTDEEGDELPADGTEEVIEEEEKRNKRKDKKEKDTGKDKGKKKKEEEEEW